MVEAPVHPSLPPQLITMMELTKFGDYYSYEFLPFPQFSTLKIFKPTKSWNSNTMNTYIYFT